VRSRIHRKNYSLDNENRLVFIALILIAVYLLPMFLLGQASHMRIQDNLDSNVAWYKVLARSGELFGSVRTMIPQIINGELSRNAFGSQFSLIVILYAVLPPMLAYSVSQLISRLFAFIGMYLLLRDYVIRSADSALIRVFSALAFALTPFWPSGMLSTLGMPLALWAFLGIRNRKDSWKEWLTLILLPFYSSFELGFFFFLSAMAVFCVGDWIRNRRINLKFLSAIVLMTVLYLLVEYRLVASLLIQGQPTNRNAFNESNLNFIQALNTALVNAMVGLNQVWTMQQYIILPLALIVLFMIFRSLKLHERLKEPEKLFLWLLGLNLLISLWYGFWFYKGWTPLKEKISILTTFNFSRYHYLHPLLIYLMFAVELLICWRAGNRWKRVAKIALILQVAILFLYNPEIEFHNQPSFKQFYAAQQFKNIADYIGKPKSEYRVASIGLHPAIAQYNGFYTLDTYNNFYPLSYKSDFRKIVAPELAKNASIRDYFDHWGGRCYLFTAELGKNYDFRKNSGVRIHHLQLNIRQFKKMGGKYILSSVPIENAGQDQLRYLRAFNNRDSAWTIYLYQPK
jgi:Predicted membrane protein